MDLHYRMYKDGDMEGIIGLLQMVFEEWPGPSYSGRAIDYWVWKYLENPIEKSIIPLCLDGENIVVCLNTIPMKIKVGNNLYKGATGPDLAVHPNYRRMGIYNNMLEKLFETEPLLNIIFHFGVVTNPILIEKSKRSGFRYFPNETHKFVKIFNMNKHVEHWDESTSKQILGYKTLNLLNKIKHGYKKKKTPTKCDITIIDRFDEQIDFLWDEVKSNYNFIVERRMDYMNWRYCHPKSKDYKVFSAVQDGVLQGYLVIFIDYNKKDYPIGYIVDVLDKQESGAVPQLLDYALTFFAKHNVNMVLWQINLGDPYLKVADFFGFLDSRMQILIEYPSSTTVNAEDLEILQSKKGKTHFYYGDYDLI